MSDLVFPSSIGGYLWDSKKKPVFNNLRHSPATGREIRIALYDQPVYEFTLSNEWLTKADKDTLIGFFLARRGGFDSFLYSDEDSTLTDEWFGTGNGVVTQFQLVNSTEWAIEIVNNVAGTPALYLDDELLTVTTDYTISSTGLVTMTTAPAVNARLEWTGTAYYRCVFLEDSLEYNQFANRLYDCDEITFKGSMANKL